MLHDAAWRSRIACVLGGALRLWGVDGAIGLDPDDAGGWMIALGAGRQVRVSHRAPAGWELTLDDPAAGGRLPLGRHAGLPGMLRRLREELAPGAPAGRLLIGAQSLLGRSER